MLEGSVLIRIETILYQEMQWSLLQPLDEHDHFLINSMDVHLTKGQQMGRLIGDILTEVVLEEK